MQSPELAARFPDFVSESPHNLLLEFLCSGGIPGLAVITALFTFGLRRQCRFRAVFAAGLVAGFFAPMSLCSLLTLWFLAGTTGVRASSRVRPAATGFGWRFGAAAAAAALLLFVFRMTVADAAWAALARATETNDVPAANGAADRAASWSGGYPGYELWASRQFAVLARNQGSTPAAADLWREARDLASRAETGGEDRAGALFQSAVLAIANTDLSGAEASARAASLAAPSWYKPHLLLSQLLAATGRNAEALELRRKATTLGWHE